ncbi:MAG: PilZ domain-containing protein [Myxococcota bacterium]
MSSLVYPVADAEVVAAEADERRTAVRFSPDPLVPVLFAHPLANVPTAGLLVNVSEGGCRIMAPPTARPKLHWGDPLQIIVSYSESTRDEGIEGLRLWAHVVRLVVDSREYGLSAAFSRAGSDGNWARLVDWIRKLSAPGR